MQLPSMAFALIPGAAIAIVLLAMGILETRLYDKEEAQRRVRERE